MILGPWTEKCSVGRARVSALRSRRKGVEVKAMVTLWVAVLALVAAGVGAADSTPVGPLPMPAVTKVTTAKGSLVAVGLLYLSFLMFHYVYQAIAHLVGWPYL